jgi:hypothetical protein
VATLDLFNQIQQQTTAKYGGASWWPAYQQAWSGGKEALAQWMTNEAPTYRTGRLMPLRSRAKSWRCSRSTRAILPG